MRPNALLKILKIIHIALCVGLVLFTGFAYLQIGDFSKANADSSLMLYIVPTIAVVGYFGSKYLFKNLIQKISKEDSLTEKLQRYQSASIVQYAVIEGPGFLSIMTYYSTGNMLFLAIAVCLIAYLYSLRPTLEKLKNELDLNFEEQKEFDTLHT